MALLLAVSENETILLNEEEFVTITLMSQRALQNGKDELIGLP